MNLQSIDFASGHKCVDNGQLDYDFHCPSHGKLFFLPYLIARTLRAEKVCPGCDQEIGQRIEKEPA